MPHSTRPPVAGIDVGATRIEVADRVVSTLVGAVRAQGVQARALRVGIHRILHDGAPDGTHLAVSLGVDRVGEDELWRLAGVAADALRLPGPTLGLDAESCAITVAPRRRGERSLVHTAAEAAQQQRERTGGRAVHFAGAADLRGPMTVAEVLAVSAVDAVLDLSGDTVPQDDDLVLIGSAVRPRWQFGLLVLHVTPAPGTDGGVYLPFDVPGQPAGTARGASGRLTSIDVHDLDVLDR